MLRRIERQIETLRKDLAQFGQLAENRDQLAQSGNCSIIQSQISATMSALLRNIREAETMADREMNMARKREQKEIAGFGLGHYNNIRREFDRLKQFANEKTVLLETPKSQHDTHSAEPENHHQSFVSAHSMLDHYLSIGTDTLEALHKQSGWIQSSQRKLAGVFESLGLSDDLVLWMERRSVRDMYIFWIGVSLVLGFIVFIYSVWL